MSTLIMVAFGSTACSNDLEVLTPEYREIPVVYSVLELHRDTLFARVTKTFVGPASAAAYARIEDSVYYPEAKVWLERWNGNTRVGRAEMQRSSGTPRKPGIFLENPNWNYILVKDEQTEIMFSGSVLNQEYHLSVEIPGKPLIFARTSAYPQASLRWPRLTSTHNFYLNPLDFTWETEAPWSELYFRLIYSDILADTTLPRQAVWREAHNLVPGQHFVTESVFGNDFMKRIAGQIRADNRVQYRHVTKLQAIVVCIPNDLHDYRLMQQVQPPDQVGFPVTNIVNGIGMFTSQTIAVFDLNPDTRTKDSIMTGAYTRHLNLKFY